MVVLGTPSAFGHFGFTTTEAVLSAVFGGCHRVHCTDVYGLQKGWNDWDKRTPLLITSDMPDPSLARLLRTCGCLFFAFFDEPEVSIDTVMSVDNYDVYDAIRYAVARFCALGNALPKQNIVFFEQNHKNDLIKNVLSLIFKELYIDEGDYISRVEEKLSAYAGQDCENLRVEEFLNIKGVHNHISHIPDLGDCDREMIREISQSYDPILKGRPYSVLKWHKDIFQYDNKYNIDDFIDLSGPGRCMIWGPYLHLPQGLWEASFVFEVYDNRSENQLVVDISEAPVSIVIGATHLPKEGIFKTKIPFDVKNTQLPLEIRVFLRKGSIEGKLKITNFVLEKREDILIS